MRFILILFSLVCLGFNFSSVELINTISPDNRPSDTLAKDLGTFFNSEHPSVSWTIENPTDFEIEIDQVELLNDSNMSSSRFKLWPHHVKKINPQSKLTLHFHSSYADEHAVGKHEDFWKISFKNWSSCSYLKLTYEVENNKSLLKITSAPPPLIKQGEKMNYIAEISNPTKEDIVLKGIKMLPYHPTEVNCETKFPITIPAEGKAELKLNYETELLPDSYQLSIAFETNENLPRNWVTVPLSGEIIFVHGARLHFDTLLQSREVEYAGDGRFEFWYTNTGNEPLILSTVKTSCGCMVADWSKEPLMPGERSVVNVRYDTKREGPSSKSVTITSNAIPSTQVIRIYIRVSAKPLEMKE